MLTTSTGEALCDSGGVYGRNWEKNQKKTLTDFQDEKEVTLDDNEDMTVTVSLFHYLTSSLSLDGLCDDFNALSCDEWNSDVYGISEKQKEWLLSHNFKIGDSWNSYNGESNLSQTIQGANINIAGSESNFEYPKYVLLQIHQGCDVRGGYTDAKLFKIDVEYFTSNPNVYGNIDGQEVNNSYNGYSLTVDCSEKKPIITEKSEVELFIAEY